MKLFIILISFFAIIFSCSEDKNTSPEDNTSCSLEEKEIKCIHPDSIPEYSEVIEKTVKITCNDGIWTKASTCAWKCIDSYIKEGELCIAESNPSDLKIPDGAKRVEGATYNFKDDFEGEQGSEFWGGTDRGSVSSIYGKVDTTASDNKVLALNYISHADGLNAHSQEDFHLPKVKEFSLLYRLYTPSNYVNNPDNANHKLLVTWSGSYSNVSEGVSVSAEMWNSVDGSGKVPSMYIAVNPPGTSGDNKGHVMRDAGYQLPAVNWEDGAWHTMYVYIKVAEREGEFGSFEIWRDNIKLVSTDDDDNRMTGGWWTEEGKPVSELINYGGGLNYIEFGYFMGWWNNASITETITFQIDDLSVLAK